jgi:hypothetical protein
MNRKVKTIAKTTTFSFDKAVNEFIAKDYVKDENITFVSDDTLFIAHIEYIDVRQ